MKLCSNCRQKVDDNIKQCPYCSGTKFLVPKSKTKNQQPQNNMNNNIQMPNQQMNMQQMPNQQMNMQQMSNQQMNMQQMSNQQMNMQQMPNQQMNMQQNNKPSQVANSNKPTKPGAKLNKAPKQQNINTSNDGLGEYISVKDWVVLMVMLAIPIVNIVVLIKGIKNPMTLPIKRNYLVAFAVYAIGSFILSVIIAVMLNSTGAIYSLV